MGRRLGIAAALLADPRTLILDEPADGLSPRESAWVDLLLRAYAARGRAVLVTGRDPRDMARLADHVITIDDGRLIADQPADELARTRLRPHVLLRPPHAH